MDLRLKANSLRDPSHKPLENLIDLMIGRRIETGRCIIEGSLKE